MKELFEWIEKLLFRLFGEKFGCWDTAYSIQDHCWVPLENREHADSLSPGDPQRNLALSLTHQRNPYELSLGNLDDSLKTSRCKLKSWYVSLSIVPLNSCWIIFENINKCPYKNWNFCKTSCICSGFTRNISTIAWCLASMFNTRSHGKLFTSSRN